MQTTPAPRKTQHTFSMQHESHVRAGWAVSTGVEESRIALDSLSLP